MATSCIQKCKVAFDELANNPNDAHNFIDNMNAINRT